jgi:ubiquinone/menaquinone biosynthesis C-methylase UbiE
MDLQEIKKREKAHHEEQRHGDRPIPPVSVAEVEDLWLRPSWKGATDRYNDSRREFFSFLLERESFEGSDILDYACGTGIWSLYYRLKGARSVVGFDLAENGVRRGMAAARLQNLDNLQLMCADATRLPYRDGSFNLVIGLGVIHHVIKYPGIFPELFRIMAPGGRAYFVEGLADNPLWKLWWHIKGEVPEGDVPIFSREVREKAAQFETIEIHGFDFFHALSNLWFRLPNSTLRHSLAQITKSADDILFRVIPPARKWGAMSVLYFEKKQS